MKRFRYPLQAVLEHHQECERELQRQAADLRNALDRESTVLDDLGAQLNQIRGELERHDTSRTYAIILLSRLDSTSARAVVQRTRTDEARTRFEHKQQEVVEAMRERKKFERHKDKGQDLHRARNEARERAEADEAATTRFVHDKLHRGLP